MSRRQSEAAGAKESAGKASMGALAEALVAALEPASIDPQKLAGLRARILSGAGRLPYAVTETIRGHEIGWQESWPRIWVKVLKRDASSGIQLALFRLEPGAVMPEHAHTKDEECVVIEGELTIGPLHLQSGDLHVAHPGTIHPAITTRTGALVFVRSEILAPEA